MKTSGWLNMQIFQVIGWTIIHSLWQILLLLVLFRFLLMIINNKNAMLRYYAGITVLIISLIWSAFTFNREYSLLVKTNDVSVVKTTPEINSNSLTKIQDNNEVTAPASVQFRSRILLLDFLNKVSPYLTLVWILGIVCYSIRIINSNIYLKNLNKIRSGFFPEVENKMMELADKMKITRSIRLIVSQLIQEPLTFGTFKPVILLPVHYVTQVSMDQIEMILAHELAHIKRLDFLVNIIQTTLEAIYFFNPFFKYISEITKNEREYCCDDIATKYSGDQKVMAIALTNLKILNSHPELYLSAAPVRNDFKNRIFRLISPSDRLSVSFKSFFFTFAALSLFLIFFSNCVNGNKERNNALVVTDSLTQTLTDNQANYKETVYDYYKGSNKHDIFLVSTVKGNPLYAYVDGTRISKDEMKALKKVLNKKRSMPYIVKDHAPDSASLRHIHEAKLSVAIDSLSNAINSVKANLAHHRTRNLENQLTQLTAELKKKNKESKDASMDIYKHEIKNIPIDVKLHEVLTGIIVKKSYSPEQRKQLNDLVAQKNKNNQE